jgi:hypothetical protein
MEMELVDVERVPTHGGSIRVTAVPSRSRRRETLQADGRVRVREAVEEEARLGVARPETYAALGTRLASLGNELGDMMRGLKRDGKRIAGFGAPAKATTLMHQFRIGRDLVDFVVDDSPLKQGLLTPGTRIPVVSNAALYERRPDYVVILAWNFADSIMTSHRAYLESGGRFIVPLPRLEVYS